MLEILCGRSLEAILEILSTADRTHKENRKSVETQQIYLNYRA